jgi:hypothetical protein
LASKEGERIMGEATIDLGEATVDNNISEGEVDLELPYVSSLFSPLGSTLKTKQQSIQMLRFLIL